MIVDGGEEALFGEKIFLEDVGRVLGDFTASSARAGLQLGKRGSSMRTSGYCLRPVSFCLRT